MLRSCFLLRKNFKRKLEKQKKFFFEKLTPVKNADIAVYEEAIDFVFENPDITNVAVSGAYSAGKSSIIESYNEKHKKQKFLHISLAHFESIDNDEENSLVDESVLEGKILNQLIHQIPVKRIPQTNFRVKRSIRLWNMVLTTLLACSLIGSIVFLSLLGKIKELINEISKENTEAFVLKITSPYVIMGVSAVLVVSCAICIFMLVKLQRNRNLLHKVTLQGNTIEIFETKDESYFDKYLNEVLYLFEQVDADVIVFEDMDRFNTSQIFERLREVNNLTNAQKKNTFKFKIWNRLKKFKICENRLNLYKPLRFFYLLRDDIFTTKDRTKFFDYIIPIVPIVDSSNSYEQFIRHLKQGNIYERFDTVFLQKLSLYIDDMRVLKNVYNEFVVYINRLDNTELNWDKMLSIVVYKNIFPRDFANLQLGTGYVHELFKRKEEIREKKVEGLKLKKQQTIDQKNKMKTEILNSVEELDCLYDQKSDAIRSEYYYYSNEKDKKIDELNAEKSRRQEIIEARKNGGIAQYEEKIAEIEQAIKRARAEHLSELITRDTERSVFSVSGSNLPGEPEDYNEIKRSHYFDLLKFLIRNAYIDETYNDYMTYFYEDSLSAQDKRFLRKITDKRGADYEYSLKDVRKILSSSILRTVDFYEEETLNFDLLNGMLESQDVPKYQEYLSALMTQLQDKKCVDFISKFYDNCKVKTVFLEKLYRQWPAFFNYITLNKNMSSQQIREISFGTLCLDETMIRSVNVENCLTDYISSQADYLNMQESGTDADQEKIISRFIFLNVSFQSIDCENVDAVLFDGVYENSLYELTYENIQLMLDKKYNKVSLDDIKYKNYSTIQSLPESPLAMYVANHMNDYLKVILENCGEEISDSEKTAIDVLNDQAVGLQEKTRYLSLLSTMISDISQVNEKELWSLMIEKGIVKRTVLNVMNYFLANALDDTLTTYMNGFDVSIDYSSIRDVFGAADVKSFFDAIAVNNNIELGRYEKILNDLGGTFDSYDTSEISEERICVLIKNKILVMNDLSLEYIRDNFDHLIKYFIDQNIKEYLQLITSDNFSYKEMLHVLSMPVEDKDKMELLQLTNRSVSVIDKKYSGILFHYILKNNFDEADENELYQHYSEYDESKQSSIYSLAERRIYDIIDSESIQLDDNLLSRLLIHSSCDISTKIQLWARAIPVLDEEMCKKHFEELGFSELKGIFTKRNNLNRTYEINDSVEAIFEALKEHTWIYDYREKEDAPGRYIVIKNKPGKC